MRKTVSLLFIVAGLSFAAPVITVIRSIGPSSDPSSPTTITYRNNALAGLITGVTPQGTPGTGGFYTPLIGGVVNANQLIDTAALFNSWLGVTPGTPSGEFGNNLYFGLSIISNGNANTFTLNQLLFQDNQGLVLFDGEFYSASFIGINYGGNGVVGGGDDSTVVLDAAGSTSVNALYYSGVSNFYGLIGGGSDQDQINAAVNALNAAGFTLTGGYCLAAVAGQTTCAPQTSFVNASVSSAVPEPSTYALFGAGLAAFAFARRRRS